MKDEQNIEKNSKKVSALNILYADDNEPSCLIAKKVFDEYGCIPDFSKNGLDAISKFKTKEYDLLFIDNLMPDVDGFTAVKEIRIFESKHRNSQCVIIMVSSNDEAKNMDNSFDIGCDGYLIKPIKKGDLIDIFEFLTGDNSEKNIEEASTGSDEKHEKEDEIIVKIDKDIESIVPEYLQNIKDGSKKIPDAIVRKDFDFIYRFGHNMKGTGTSYGFASISEMGKILEQAGTDKNIQVINEEIKKLTEYIEKVHILYE